MSRATRPATALLVAALVLALPLAHAEWRGRGFYEPDTARDLAAARGHHEPDTSPDPQVRKVYFSGFPMQAHPGGFAPTGNPNVGLLGSQIAPYPTSFFALLGVWKDCNRDGYVGIAESAGADLPHSYGDALLLMQTYVTGEDTADTIAGTPDHAYASALLLDATVCPPGTFFNDGTTVREWWPIGPDDTSVYDVDYGILDLAARVWADYGHPEDLARASCPVNPPPRGSTQSTGGLLRWTDCLAGWQITGAANAAARATDQDDLAFDDAPRERPDQSNSTLNRPNPWGQPDGPPLVSAFDCDAEPVVLHDDTGLTHLEVPDPTGGTIGGLHDPTGTAWQGPLSDDGALARANLTDERYERRLAGQPRAPPRVDPSGGPAGTVNETESSTRDCELDEPRNCGGRLSTTAPTDQHTGGDVYCRLEKDNEGIGPQRTRTDFYFTYGEGAVPGQWRGASVVDRNPLVNRDDLQPWGGVVVTFYAYVSHPDVRLAERTAATYGAPHCAGTTPITGSWACDPAAWWREPDGSRTTTPKAKWQILPGQPYNLVDSDCYDYSPYRGSPAHTGFLGRACERPATPT